MSAIIEKTSGAVTRYGMFGEGDVVAVAVSGGPDSVCLFETLYGLRSRFDIELRVVHVDHVTRDGESAADAEFVNEMAERHGVACDVVRADVESGRMAGESFEEAARRVRYEAFGDVARKTGATRVATAHTADDQAETVLMRILRGTGPLGLAGIPPVTEREGYTVVRPFIEVWRREIEQHLEDGGIETRCDRTNATECCLRNRIRLNLLPSLETEFNPAVKSALVQLANLTREEQAFLTDVARDMAGGDVACVKDGQVVVDRAAFRKLPVAIARRAVMAWGTLMHSRPWRGTGEAVDKIRDALRSESTTGEMHFADGLRLRLEYEKAVIEGAGPGAAVEDEEVRLPAPGRTDLGWADVCLSARVVPRESVPADIRNVCGPDVQYFDAEKVSGGMWLRRRRPGDSFRPMGLGGTIKVCDHLINRKVPARLRDRLPILCCETGIMWVVGHGADERYAVDDGTAKLFEVRVDPL
jgi:tRNA(Ile)-lysidine synthase